MLVELPGRVTAWVVTQHELLRQVLTDPRVANSRYWDASTSGEVPAGWPLEEYISLESMTTADGAEHRRLRSLIVQAFTPRRVAALRPRIERITADLLHDLAARAPGPVDLVAGYSYQLPMRVVGELLGTPTDRLDQLRPITRSLVSSTSTADEVDRTEGEPVSYLADLVALKRREPGDDLTAGLIEAHDEGDRLTGSELVGTLTGHDRHGPRDHAGPAHQAVCALLTHPDQLALVRDGQHPWTAVIEETLRWDSPLGHCRCGTPQRTSPSAEP